MISTYAIPRFGSRCRKSSENASIPPAEAPKPTMGKGFGSKSIAIAFVAVTFLRFGGLIDFAVFKNFGHPHQCFVVIYCKASALTKGYWTLQLF
jgi:hypothetical protein